jgi:hypothetical protein
MQQPPPEEATAAPPKPINPTKLLAKRLRNAYFREKQYRTMRFRNEDKVLCIAPSRVAETSEKLWLTVAKKVHSVNITNAERFVHAQFQFGAVKFPGTLGTDKAFNCFYDYDAKADIFLKQDWKCQTLAFEGGVIRTGDSYPQFSEAENWEFVLCDLTLDLIPLFRYCVAMSEYLFTTAKIFETQALHQMLTDPLGYAESWRGNIPQTLLDNVSNIIMTPL